MNKIKIKIDLKEKCPKSGKVYNHKKGERVISERKLPIFEKFGWEVVEEKNDTGKMGQTEIKEDKTIYSMNKSELVEYAKENSIEIDESATKKVIIETIELSEVEEETK